MKPILFCLLLTTLFSGGVLAKTNPNVRIGTSDEVRLQSLRGDLIDLRAYDGPLADDSSASLSKQADAARAVFKKAGINVSRLNDSQVVAAAKDKRVDVACNELTYNVTVIEDPLPVGREPMTLSREQVPASKVDEVVSFLSDAMSLACGLNAPAPRVDIKASGGFR